MKNNLKTFPKCSHRAESYYIVKSLEWKRDFEAEIKHLCEGCQHNAFMDGSSSQTPNHCSLEICIRFHPKELLGE
jgi:hypothetical protein